MSSTALLPAGATVSGGTDLTAALRSRAIHAYVIRAVGKHHGTEYLGNHTSLARALRIATVQAAHLPAWDLARMALPRTAAERRRPIPVSDRRHWTTIVRRRPVSGTAGNDADWRRADADRARAAVDAADNRRTARAAGGEPDLAAVGAAVGRACRQVLPGE